MTEELRGMEIMRADFVRNVSHEFKTPVSSIRGFAKMLKEDCKSPYLSTEEREEFIDIILNESGRLGSMSSNILLLSKIEGQETPVGQSVFRLDEQIRRIAASLEPALAEKRINFDTNLEAVSLKGNEEFLSHVWLNILGNSIKFTPPEGKITVSLARNGATAFAIFTDTGCGMDEETRKHIFDKFYQGDRSHSTEGNGLGMSLAKRIVELHRGSVSVESRPGQGARVSVTLPGGRSQ
jgi:signal transduction histidine kinase